MPNHSFLFVDDDPLFGDLMRHFADEAYPGAQVVSLEDASAVAEICASRNFECVVFDHHLPGISGFNAATDLRREFPYLPIVMVTGSGDEMLAAAAFKGDLNDYVAKSRLSAQTMRQAIEHAITVMAQKRIIDAQREELERKVVDEGKANKALALANQILENNEAALEALVMERTAALRTEINTRRIMATAIAHELNQPLAAILAFLQALTLLAERDDTSPAVLNTIADLSRRAGSQAIRAGDILKLLRNSIIRDNTARTEEDIGTIVEEVLAIELADAKGLDVTFRFNEPKSRTRAVVKRTQIRQVLSNLIQNAVEAVSGTDVREVTVTLFRDQETKVVRVDVADTGPGISPEMAEGLFMPFLSNKPNGMGIGLSISREIVEEHQGVLTTKPNPAGGAIFSFVLPIGNLPVSA
jgi:two-component system, LuxR family, sensor kinase FixL